MNERSLPIVIKTYAADALWLRHCLRSIELHAPWCSAVILVTERDSLDAIDAIARCATGKPRHILPIDAMFPGAAKELRGIGERDYWWMVWTNWQGDAVVPSGMFWSMDSDTIFNRPTKVADLARWFVCPRATGGDAVETWAPRTDALGLATDWVYMIEPGFLLDGRQIAAARHFIEHHIGCSLLDYMVRARDAEGAEWFPAPLSSRDPLGAWLRMHDQPINWIKLAHRDALADGQDFLTHAWSWGGYTEERSSALDGTMDGRLPPVRRIP